MLNAKTDLHEKFHCQKHKGEQIQRFSPSIYSKDVLYCLECIVENNRAGKYETLLKFDEYIDLICKSKSVDSLSKFKDNKPTDLIMFLQNEELIVQDYEKHIAKQKQIVDDLAHIIKEKVQSILNGYKDRINYELETQLNTLKFNFNYARVSMSRWYDGASNSEWTHSEKLKEDLLSEKSTRSLERYIKMLNRDVLEQRVLNSSTSPEAQEQMFINGREYTRNWLHQFKDQVEVGIKPALKSSQALKPSNVIHNIHQFFSQMFKDEFSIENEIVEIAPFVKDESIAQTSDTPKISKEKVVLSGGMTLDKFNTKLERLRSLLSETSQKIGTKS